MRRWPIIRRRGGRWMTWRRAAREQHHPSAVCRSAWSSEVAARGRGVHLRCGNADRLGGSVSAYERQAPADRVVQSWLDGQRAAAGDRRPGGYPARQVISMSGDGGFTHDDGRLHHAEPAWLPVKVIVLNNGTLGFVEMEMKATGSSIPGATCKNPDFAAMADAMGIKGIRVEQPQQLKAALARRCARRPGAGRCGERAAGARHAAEDHAVARRSTSACSW